MKTQRRANSVRVYVTQCVLFLLMRSELWEAAVISRHFPQTFKEHINSVPPSKLIVHALVKILCAQIILQCNVSHVLVQFSVWPGELKIIVILKTPTKVCFMFKLSFTKQKQASHMLKRELLSY